MRLGVALALLALIGCPEETKPQVEPEPLLLLVRHGESWKNVGRDEDALTPKGQEQIAAVASALQGRGVKAIYCSPTGRTKETAAILAKALSLEPKVEDALVTLKKDEKPDRARAFASSLHGAGPIVLVTHGDIIEALVGHEVATGSLTELRQATKR